ncbi:hypothetical protein F4804DRAFT_256638 [Jackrogersella minutella]|nr:hypothetical protein F4804DRAFT_256638 [Jackrogersella minutella]
MPCTSPTSKVQAIGAATGHDETDGVRTRPEARTEEKTQPDSSQYNHRHQRTERHPSLPIPHSPPSPSSNYSSSSPSSRISRSSSIVTIPPSSPSASNSDTSISSDGTEYEAEATPPPTTPRTQQFKESFLTLLTLLPPQKYAFSPSPTATPEYFDSHMRTDEEEQNPLADRDRGRGGEGGDGDSRAVMSGRVEGDACREGSVLPSALEDRGNHKRRRC